MRMGVYWRIHVPARASNHIQHLESIKRDNATPREKGYTEEMEEFSRQFLGAVQDVYNCTDPATSSHLLRNLVKSKLLMYTDMRDRPEKFFLAHRLLSTIGYGCTRERE